MCFLLCYLSLFKLQLFSKPLFVLITVSSTSEGPALLIMPLLALLYRLLLHFAASTRLFPSTFAAYPLLFLLFFHVFHSGALIKPQDPAAIFNNTTKAFSH